MMKKLTENEVVLVVEEIQNTVELIIECRLDSVKVGFLQSFINKLSDMLTIGYEDCFTFDRYFNYIRKLINNTYLKDYSM